MATREKYKTRSRRSNSQIKRDRSYGFNITHSYAKARANIRGEK